VKHEGDPLARGEPVEDDVQGEADGVGERDVVRRIVDGLPEFDVVHGYRGAGAQPVQAQPGGHRRQPGRQIADRGVGPVQPQPRLLHDVLGLGVVAEHPASDRRAGLR